MPAGGYRIQYFDQLNGYLPEYYDNALTIDSSADVVVAPGQTVTGIDAAMGGIESPGRSIAGHVYLKDGVTPARDVKVTVLKYDIVSDDFVEYGNVTTSADGSFVFRGLESAAYRLKFSDLHRNGLQTAMTDEFRVDEEDVSDIRMNMIPVGLLRELVVFDEKEPLSGELLSGFEPGKFEYEVNVPKSTDGLNFVPSFDSNNGKYKCWINGVLVDDGESSARLRLKYGNNAVKIEVGTEVNGMRKVISTYTVTVHRKASSNAKLSKLAVKGGKLKPGFKPNKQSYGVDVSKTQKSLRFRPVAQDKKAKISIGGKRVKSGTYSKPIPLKKGKTVVKIVVEAQDGTKRTYTATATRE